MSATPVLVVADTPARLVQEIVTTAALFAAAALLLLVGAVGFPAALVLWAAVLGLPGSLLWRRHGWSREEPYLVANQEGVWLKDWDALDVIDWGDIAAVETPAPTQLRLVLAKRDRYRMRLFEADIVSRGHVFVPRGLTLDFRALDVAPADVARVLERHATRRAA